MQAKSIQQKLEKKICTELSLISTTGKKKKIQKRRNPLQKTIGRI